jgi:oligopeptide transport system substrate-binding protein
LEPRFQNLFSKYGFRLVYVARLWPLAVAALLVLPAARGVAAQSASAREVTVNFLNQGEPDTLDPNRTTSAFAAEAGVVRQVFEPLLRFDEHLVPQPAAAESYDVSPDGTQYTFHLRADGRWSDGQPVTAPQFEYSWRRLLDPALNAEYATFFVSAGIDSVTAVDDLTFVVRLAEPFGPLPDIAALWVGSPLRPDVVNANVDGWAADPATYVGNGPFMVSEWVHQDHIALVPNPAYVAHGVWPVPSLTRVIVRMQTSAQADYAAFLSGDRDWALVPDAELNAVLNDADLSPLAQPVTDLTTFWIQLNTVHQPLNNTIVRRALAKALDRRALVRDLTAGVAAPTLSVLPPGMPGHQDALGAELDFDPEGARTLLAQAGFARGRGFPKLAFAYPNGAVNQRRAEYFVARWREVLGVDIGLSAMPNAAYQQALHERAYDIAFGGWAADYPDPQDWFAPVFGCQGAYNYYAYCSPSFDQTVARGDTAAALADRLVYYAQASTQLVRDVPVIPVWVRGRLLLVRPWVQLTLTAQDDFPGSYLLDRVVVMPH